MEREDEERGGEMVRMRVIARERRGREEEEEMVTKQCNRKGKKAG